LGKLLQFPIKTDSVNQSQQIDLVPVERQDSPELRLPEKIVDITNILREHGARDRRRAQRVVLGHLVSSHVVLPKFGLAQVAIRDIDKGGLAFEMDSFLGAFQKGDQLEMRFYLNGQTYFKINIVVAYSALDEELGVSRHGARFIAESLNQEALQHFIQFLRTVSVSLQTDRGERVVSNLTS